jgi:hypothetical protein
MKEVQQKLFNLKFPEYWREEGAEPPNKIAIDNAYKCCCELCSKYDLLVTRIACTIESGVYLVFEQENLNLIIETYNDGDIGVLVTKDKEILFNEDIHELDFSNCIKVLREDNYGSNN